jgi:hypothetical protein
LIDGRLVKIYIFCYILSFSRYRIYSVSLSDTQGSVLEALENGLIQTEGVPNRVKTDNARVFVTNASRHNLVWNHRYLNFCGHYGFTPTRSMPGHPWSKGKVESPFAYLETHFIADHHFESFEQLTRKLSLFQDGVNGRVHAATGATSEEMFRSEKGNLGTLPFNRYIDIKEEIRKASSDCLISFKGNKYSVPHFFACREVWIRISQGCYLKIYSSQGKLLASHTLSTQKGKVIINHDHYRNHRIQRGSWERLCHS